MLNNLVVSLETAKFLKEKGWSSDTYFTYGKNGAMLEPPFGWSADMDLAFPAPTAEEILRDLPQVISVYKMYIFKFGKRWRIIYGSPGLGRRLIELTEDSLSEAAAQMWIWCKKEGYIK